MKKHLIRALVLFFGLTMLSSCLKDNPKENATVFYGHQQIPNINEFMPQSLLEALGNQNLYFGDEPPKLEGCYIADSIVATRIIRIPGSHWIQTEGPIQGIKQLKFSEQHFGIAKLRYDFFNYSPQLNGIIQIEASDTDTTYLLMKDYVDQFVADSLSPSYFHNEFSNDVFNTVYIMGRDPYFTIFYYEIRLPSQFRPLYANIISGKVDKESIIETDTVSGLTDTIVRPVIKDLKWGIETMKYFEGGHILDLILNQEHQTPPKPGDILILKNAKDIHIGEYQE
jgi:hypothetical protein